MQKNYIPRKKRSKIWQLSVSQLQYVVDTADSLTHALRVIGVAQCGGNRAALRHRLAQEGIACEYLLVGKPGWPKGKKQTPRKYDHSLIFTQDGSHTRQHVKHVLLRDKLMPEQCAICKLQPTWQNKPLTLVLDHINGEAKDNRLENLRLLCPNCNSQTNTFSWKNVWNKRRSKLQSKALQ